MLSPVHTTSAEVGPCSHVESSSVSRIGCSADEPVHEKGAEQTCYSAVGCRASAWCVRTTLDPDAAD